MSTTVNELLQGAQDDGILSPASYQTLHVVDLGQQIQQGMGVRVDDVQTSEVVLVTIMPDDSGSIRFAGNAQAVRDGHNEVLRALGESKQQDQILVQTRYLNGDVLFPYGPLDQAIEMDSQNYNPDKGTPLYDQTAIVLGSVVAKTQEFADNGVPVRSITLLVTDGDDQHSTKATAADVQNLVEDLKRQETHVVAFLGIEDRGGGVNFKDIARQIGIDDQWILTVDSDASAIRKAFQVFSQSALQVSQAAGGNFSSSGLGGFGS